MSDFSKSISDDHRRLDEEFSTLNEAQPMLMQSPTEKEIHRADVVNRPPEIEPGNGQTTEVARINIDRPVYDLKAFEAGFERRDGQPDVSKSVRKKLASHIKKECRCSKAELKKALLGYIPFVQHLRDYRWREWILSDVVAGLSAGVVHVPQGMGFALLAGVAPVYGLYTSFFPGWLYYIFGTSRHLSFGTMAVTALMVGAVVNREFPIRFPASVDHVTDHVVGNATGALGNGSWVTNDQIGYNNVTGDWYVSDKQQLEDVRRASIAVSITMIAGLIQLLMRVLRLGILTSYMSLPFVSSFTTGCALHIMLNQLPFQLGFPVDRLSGVFQLPVLIYRIASNIGRTNPSALVTSLICTAFLVGMKEGVNEKFRKKLPVPVPAELILVIVATTISHFARLDQLFHLKVIGKIPTGIPAPRIPSMAGAQDLIVDGVIIAVIGFAMAITMAKLMSDRHEYEIDSNQELLAYGITNTVCSMFGCFMSTQAPPRTMVQEATGCKTQLAGFISTILPFFVALFMGPLFTSLPVSVLGTICSCALLPLMKQFREIPGLWRVNRTDAFVWLVTFICTVLLNVPCGLIIGIAVSLFAVIIQAQLASGHRLSQAGQTEIFFEIPPNTDAKPEIDFCVFRFDSSLFFANVNSFKCQLFASTFNPVEEKKSASVVKAPVQETVANDTPRIVENGVTGKIDLTINDVNENRYISTDLWQSEKMTFETGNAVKPLTNEREFKNGDILRGHGNKETGPVKEKEGEGAIPGSRSRRVIVLDCSRITYIDVMGLSTLRQVMTLYRSVGSSFVLANCSCDMVERMRRFNLIADTSDIEGKSGEQGVVEGKHILVYPTVLDACVASQNIYDQ